jgi:hypothetical protein
MELLLERAWVDANATVGTLAIDGVFQNYTLERPAVQIPAARYQIQLYPSPHFQRMMPLLMNVPGRTGIEIHFGNYPTQSEGCILVGQTRMGTDDVGNSDLAFDALFAKIQGAIEAGDSVWITVVDAPSKSLPIA